MSGVSLLASKLKTHSRQSSNSSVWTSQETVKLTDSIAPQPPEPLSIDEIREQLNALIRQTNDQEKALLRYHAEIEKLKRENNELRVKVVRKNDVRFKNTIFSSWRRLRNTQSEGMKTPQSRCTTPLVTDSVNLNETLRNLALSLASPLSEHHSNALNISTSTVKSAMAIPFQTARRQKHFQKS